MYRRRVPVSGNGHKAHSERWKGKSIQLRVLVAYILFIVCFWTAKLTFMGLSTSSKEIFLQTKIMDVVGVAYKPTCVTKKSISGLNTHLNPRHINVITTSQSKCETFKAMAPNVRCYYDGDVVPNVTKESIDAFLGETYGETYANVVLKSGKEIAGWYLQQMVKLGVSRYIDDLTENFLIWDLDMMPMRHLEPFTNSNPPKANVNIGGHTHSHRGYEISYENLTNQRLETAPDGSSFVTHSLSVNKRRMEEFVQYLEKGERDSWPWRILRSVDPNYIDMGFSEYASYISWMKQNHPSEIHIKDQRTWSRYPFSFLPSYVPSSWGVATQMLFNRDHLCCPTDALLTLLKPLGYEFMGFEIGHSSTCDYHNPKYEEGYGV